MKKYPTSFDYSKLHVQYMYILYMWILIVHVYKLLCSYTLYEVYSRHACPVHVYNYNIMRCMHTGSSLVSVMCLE